MGGGKEGKGDLFTTRLVYWKKLERKDTKVMGEREERKKKLYNKKERKKKKKKKATFPPLIIHTNTNKGTCLL